MIPSLYVHIPLCKKKCDYCDFFSIIPENSKTQDLVIEALQKELAYRCAEYKVTSWKSIYIGGGTPSLLLPNQIRTLCKNISQSISPAFLPTNIEWTIEANPEDISIEWLQACSESGINRISVGIQSMNDTVLREAGRRGCRKSNYKALELLHTQWHGKLSLDFIAGLPNQKKEDLINDLTETFFYKPDHISLYSLTVEEGTPLEKKINNNSCIIPDNDEASDMWIAGRDFLENNGFIQYEVSNFSKPGFESSHNETYWNMNNWLAIGPGGSATIVKNDTAVRYTNIKNVSLWLKDPFNTVEQELLSKKDLLSETLIMGFRMIKGINRKAFFLRFGKDLLEVIGKTVYNWQKKQLVIISDEHVSLTKNGLLFLNSFLCDCFQEIN
ncbi:MAG TPA: radical SAM family heme chaperone HemW [Treponemataceae bacterium]|nr:radical SAM family heme chaperone HemW [Treponemataceae bacterium]